MGVGLGGGGKEVRATGGYRLQELAATALKEYGLPGANPHFLRAGRGKHIFRVSSPDRGGLLLRMYAPPVSAKRKRSFSEPALRSQLLWQESLRREAGLPVPEPVRTPGGALTARAATQSVPEARFCVLVSWVPGQTRSAEELSAEDMSLTGALVALMHDHAGRYTAPEGFSRPRYDWNHLFRPSAGLWKRGAEVYTASEMEVLRAVAERARREMLKLGEDRKVFGLIHRDIHPENLVFGRDGVSVIDFEGCGWGHYLYDLAVTLFRLEDHGNRGAALREAFLEGYQRVRPLSESHQVYLQTFVALRVVNKINGILLRDKPASHPQAAAFLSGSPALGRLAEYAEGAKTRERGGRWRPRSAVSSWASRALGRWKGLSCTASPGLWQTEEMLKTCFSGIL